MEGHHGAGLSITVLWTYSLRAAKPTQNNPIADERREKHGVHGVPVESSRAANTCTCSWGRHGGVLVKQKSILPDPACSKPQAASPPSSILDCSHFARTLRLCPLLLSSAPGSQPNTRPWSLPVAPRLHTSSTTRGCCDLQPRPHPSHNTHTGPEWGDLQQPGNKDLKCFQKEKTKHTQN